MLLMLLLRVVVYKDLIISTIVDYTRGGGAPRGVYKDLIISTIVDFCFGWLLIVLVYKDLIISTIVDSVTSTSSSPSSL